jgi:hemerythrin-like domain-containing protein
MMLPDRPNVGANLIVVHAAITRGLDVTIEKSKSFAVDGFSVAVPAGFLDYVRALVTVLHAHHQSEDEVAFPYFRQRLPDAPYDTLQAEHQAIVPVLAEMSAALDQITGRYPEAALDNLHEAALYLRGLWHAHIEKEELHFDVGVLEQCLEPAEHDQLSEALGAFNQKHMDPVYLAMPFVLYNLPDEQRAYLSRGLPPALTQELVPITWRDRWAPMKPFLLA